MSYPGASLSRRGDPGAGDQDAALSAAVLTETAEAARAAFKEGDSERAARLLHAVFVKGKDRDDMSLVAEVKQLLDIEGDLFRRKQYLEYLLARGAGDAAFDAQMSYAATLAASTDSAVVEKAWQELSQAYELATDAAQRRQVVEQLDPFIKRNVFSKRFSPLLKSYSVKPGDLLSRIAGRHDTTVDAIVRLNGLASPDKIQPRTRLRILPGKAAIFVDKSDFRLWLTIGDRLLFERRVGLGRDNSTPVGKFEIRVRQKNPAWYRPGEAPIPAGEPGNVLGTRWLGFEDTEEYSGYGIHGTEDSASIGVESSAGCVRLLTPDVELLYDFAPRGTPVTIRE